MTVYGWLYRGRIFRQELEARWAAFCDGPRLARAYEAAWAVHPVRRPLWCGLLRPAPDRRLLAG